MPTREISISVSVLGLQDASTAARGFSGDVRDVGAAASEATAQAAPLGAAVDKTAVSLKSASASGLELTGTLRDQIGPAAAAAAAAIARLGDIQGVRGLSVGIVQGQIAMENFKKAIVDAEAAGTKMPANVGAALTSMQGSLTAATQRLGTLKAGMAEVGAQAQAMGASWKQAAASGGSLNSMMFNLAETSGGATAALAKTGLAGIGVFEAFKVGMVIGTEVDKFLKTVGVDFSRLGDPANFASAAVAGFSTKLAAMGIGGAEFTRWAKDATAAMNEFSDVMQPVILNVNTLMKVHQEAARQLTADEEALKKVGVAWHDVGAEQRTVAEQMKLLDDALHKTELLGESQIDTIMLNAKALQELRQRLEDEGISLDTLSPRLRTAILLSDGLVDAHTKHATALKLVRESTEQVIPGMDKLLNTLQKEDVAAVQTGQSVTGVANAHERAVLALVKYGVENGLSAEQVAKLIKAQSDMLDVTKAATGEGILRMNIALQANGVNLEDVAKKTETLADAQVRLAKETANANAEFDRQAAVVKARNDAIDAGTITTDAAAKAWGASMTNISKTTAQAMIDMAGLTKSQHDAATEALAAADAFGREAGGLTSIKLAADGASAGLVGVMWSMRNATPATLTLTDSQKALIESLAKVSDQYGQTSLWVGHLIAQFEAGSISIADFRSQLAQMLIGMNTLPDAFGHTAVEMNALLTLIDKFKNTAKDGWPVTTSTQPYYTAP